MISHLGRPLDGLVLSTVGVSSLSRLHSLGSKNLVGYVVRHIVRLKLLSFAYDESSYINPETQKNNEVRSPIKPSTFTQKAARSRSDFAQQIVFSAA